MTFPELSARFQALADELQGEIQREVETVAETGKAMVIQRVSETGKDAQGRAFEPYTRQWEQKKRGAVSTAKKEGAKKKAARKTAPASLDKPVGRYRGFVDFTFTGRMLSNIGLVEKKTEGARAVVRIGGRTDETRLKMEGNDKNRKGWFRLSEKEIQELRDQSAARFGRFIENFLTA
jgi:hypothetical protein